MQCMSIFSRYLPLLTSPTSEGYLRRFRNCSCVQAFRSRPPPGYSDPRNCTTTGNDKHTVSNSYPHPRKGDTHMSPSATPAVATELRIPSSIPRFLPLASLFFSYMMHVLTGDAHHGRRVRGAGPSKPRTATWSAAEQERFSQGLYLPVQSFPFPFPSPILFLFSPAYPR